MKKLFLFIAVCGVLSLCAQTSTYHPFPEGNAFWNVSYTQTMCPLGGDACENFSITMTGDTMINGLVYHKLFTPYVYADISGGCTQVHFHGYKGAIRQDIPNKKVYYFPPADFTVEQLLYDFTMEVGDTVKGYLSVGWMEDNVVVSIDSVIVGQNFHKRWLVNPCYGIYLIEGVGCSYGLLEFLPGCQTDMPVLAIECFQYQGETLYPTHISNCSVITSIPENEFLNNIQIYPNPARGSFMVSLAHPAGIKEIRITNAIGHMVWQKQIISQSRVTIDNLSGGVYVLTVIDQNNQGVSKKIVLTP